MFLSKWLVLNDLINDTWAFINDADYYINNEKLMVIVKKAFLILEWCEARVLD